MQYDTRQMKIHDGTFMQAENNVNKTVMMH